MSVFRSRRRPLDRNGFGRAGSATTLDTGWALKGQALRREDPPQSNSVSTPLSSRPHRSADQRPAEFPNVSIASLGALIGLGIKGEKGAEAGAALGAKESAEEGIRPFAVAEEGTC